MKVVHALNALLLTALIALSLYVYPALPAEIPVHFGADGSADGWAGRSLLRWLMLPLVGAGTVLLLYGVGAVIPRRPQSLNMPDRKKLLELPPPLQRWVIAGTVNVLYVMALTMLLMFCGIQYGAWEVAQTRVASPIIVASLIFSLVMTPFVVVALLVVNQRRLDRAWRDHQAAESRVG